MLAQICYQKKYLSHVNHFLSTQTKKKKKIIKPLTLNKQFNVDNNEIDEQIWTNRFTR